MKNVRLTEKFFLQAQGKTKKSELLAVEKSSTRQYTDIDFRVILL